MGVAAAGETPSLTEESIAGIHRVLKCTQTHLPGNQEPKGPIHFWVVEEVTESVPRAEQVAFFPLEPLPHIQCHNTVTWVAPPWGRPKAVPLRT